MKLTAAPADDHGRPIMPVPDGAPPPPSAHPTRGRPTATWTYLDEHGGVLLYEWRFDRNDKKTILPLTYRELADGSKAWMFLGIRGMRPLYGLDRLARRPEAPAIVVEGPKTADAAQKIFPDHVVVTWLGGANAAAHADVATLVERDRIILWPDNDEHGRAAMRAIAAKLRRRCYKIVDLRQVEKRLGALPQGWDLADYEGDPDVIRKLVNQPGVALSPDDELRANVEDWEAPTSFTAKAPPEADLFQLIPDSGAWLRDLAHATSEEIGVAKDWPLLLILGAANLAICGAVELEVREGYREQAPLWILALGRPSERKSPVFSAITRPIRDWEKATGERLGRELAKYNARRSQLIKHLEKGEIGGNKEPKKQIPQRQLVEGLAESLSKWPELRCPILTITDTTAEALAEAMLHNGGVVGIVDDEGAAIAALLGRYSDDEPRVEIVNKGYTGTRVTIIRARRDPLIVDRPLVCQILTVQPAVLSDIVQNRSAVGRGFLARYLIIEPRSHIGLDKWDSNPVPPTMSERWAKLVLKLLDLPRPGRIVNAQDDARAKGMGIFSVLENDPPLVRSTIKARCIKLSARATKLAGEYYDREAKRMGDALDDVGWDGKSRGHIFRVALTLHMLVDGGDEIKEATMRAAIAWHPYLREHFMAALGNAIDSQAVHDAKRLLKKLRAQPDVIEFTRSQAYKWIENSAFREAAMLDPVLAELEERGYIRQASPGRSGPGRPPERYEVNPRLHLQDEPVKPAISKKASTGSAGSPSGSSGKRLQRKLVMPMKK